MAQRPVVSAALLLAVLLAACGDDADETSADRTTSSTSASDAPAEDARVEAARADLVERFGHDPSDIEVVSVESVTWPDAALGCPAEDGQYAQMLVPGYRIVLRWQDEEYRYHGADGDDAPPFLCEQPG